MLSQDPTAHENQKKKKKDQNLNQAKQANRIWNKKKRCAKCVLI